LIFVKIVAGKAVQFVCKQSFTCTWIVNCVWHF